MAELEIQKATKDDLGFCWKVYAENVKPLIKPWVDDHEKARFTGRWSAQGSCIINLDGERIGWLSFLVSKTEISIENLQLMKGHTGIPSMILNIFIADATRQNKKVSLLTLKNDPSTAFLREEENFLSGERSDDHVKIDVTGFWDSSRLLRSTCLPWNIQSEVVSNEM